MIDRVPVDELQTLAGRTRPRMLATLQSWGLTPRTDIDGWPIVLRADLERVLSSYPTPAAPPRKRPRLDAATM